MSFHTDTDPDTNVWDAPVRYADMYDASTLRYQSNRQNSCSDLGRFAYTGKSYVYIVLGCDMANKQSVRYTM